MRGDEMEVAWYWKGNGTMGGRWRAGGLDGWRGPGQLPPVLERQVVAALG